MPTEYMTILHERIGFISFLQYLFTLVLSQCHYYCGLYKCALPQTTGVYQLWSTATVPRVTAFGPQH